jgi:oligopeptide transport system ATP-binding protein
MPHLLEIQKLSVRYKGRGKSFVHAVEDVSVSVAVGETLGLVGESGCGKSTLVRAVMGLVKPSSGRILLDGDDLLKMPPAKLRGTRLDYQMVFQDPFASLDPAMTVGEIILEAANRRKKTRGDENVASLTTILERVGLPPESASRLPHEFSGGQRQRIAIARALATKPRLLIADEAVSALDVSVQSQILNLLMKLRREDSLTMIFVSHDLSVVRHISTRIAVMYLGKIVELGPAKDVMEKPLHMYTRALISASPVPDPVIQKQKLGIILRGEPPSPANPPAGCAFAWRSQKIVSPGVASIPGRLREVSEGRWVEIHPATVDDSDELNAKADAFAACKS